MNQFVRLYCWVQSAAVSKERGAGLAEYALLVALIAVLMVGSLGAFRGALQTVFTNISNALTNAPN